VRRAAAVVAVAMAALAVPFTAGGAVLVSGGGVSGVEPLLVPHSALRSGPALRPPSELAARRASRLASLEVLRHRAARRVARRHALQRHRLWARAFRSARAYARSRLGRVSIALVDDQGLVHSWLGRRTFFSASLVKAMLLVSYLRRREIRRRPLSASSRALLRPMITRSDNNAATAVRNIVGNAGLARLARRVGMRWFASALSWGDTHLSAEDQAVFFYGIDKFLPPRHRRYGMRLLAHVIAPQRWGTPEVVPRGRGERVFFKGGWRPSVGGWIVNQAALVKGRGGRRMALAVLTDHDRTDGYGHETVRGVAARLVRVLAAK
jgi:hypothetical protein